MQVARLAIETEAAIIVQTERQVTRLLHLIDHDPSAQGVYGTCPEKDDVINGDILIQHGVFGSSLRQGLSQSGLVGAFLQPESQTRTIGVQYVPRLRLAERAQPFSPRIGVIGMYLDGEILLRIDELDQQRKIIAVTSLHGSTHKILSVTGDEIPQAQAGQRAGADDTFLPGQGGDLEGLTDGYARRQILAETLQAAPTPDDFSQIRRDRNDLGQDLGQRVDFWRIHGR